MIQRLCKGCKTIIYEDQNVRKGVKSVYCSPECKKLYRDALMVQRQTTNYKYKPRAFKAQTEFPHNSLDIVLHIPDNTFRQYKKK